MRRRDLLVGGTMALLAPRLARAEGRLKHLTSPQDFAAPTDVFDRLITPNDQFFVRSHFGAPALDRSRKLRIVGSKSTVEFGVEDLARLQQHEHVAVLQCAGNGRSLHSPRVPGLQWVHGAMGQAAWRGVVLADLLEFAGIPADAQHVRLTSVDLPPKPVVPAWVRSIPLQRALDVSTLICTHMNGEPLPHAHGAPFRLVVPGWSGNHWMKWLREIKPQKDEAEGFYQRTGYRMPKTKIEPGKAVKPEDTAPAMSFPIKSLIGRPADGSKLKAGRAEVVGVAFSGEAPIARVEVSVDGGTSWKDAKLEGEAAIGRWQVFRLPFDAKPGALKAVARATDKKGEVQPQNASWNPSGYFWNGWHVVDVEVTA